MTLQRAVLTLKADVDQDGTLETGEFHMVGDLEVRPGLRPNFTLGGAGSTLSSILGSVTDGEFGGQREGLFLDLGAGQHIVEIAFLGWEGAIDENGDPVQWGNTGTTGTPTQADATGADPITQIDVLMRYLVEGRIDSTRPATLEYGEYSSSGLYEPLKVVLEGPSFQRVADEGSMFTGSMVCISASGIDTTDEETERNNHG